MTTLQYRKKLFAVAVIFTMACGISKGQQQEQQFNPVEVDIPYARLSDCNKLDVYIPENGKKPYPVIIGIHGGAFWAGDKQAESFVYKNGLDRGYAVVCINYRLSQEAKFPAQIHDVKAAIRWVRAHAKDYGFDPHRVAVWGTSAGGYLSAMAGTSGDVAELEDLSMGYADQSSRVQAVVDWYGPINFLTMDSQDKETGMKPIMDIGHDDPDSPESALMGTPIQEIPEQVAKANPETYISADDPPFYIQHGLADDHVHWKQSISLAEKLQHVLGKDKVSLHLWENVGHGTDQFFTPENYVKSLDFLDKIFKK